MRKTKAALVTSLVAAMFAVIYGGLYLLYKPGFIILTVLLTIYGFLRGVSDFHKWLIDDSPVGFTDKASNKRPVHNTKSQSSRPDFDVPLDAAIGYKARRQVHEDY